MQLPAQLSTFAAEHDAVYGFVASVSAAAYVAVVGTMIVLAVRYRRRAGVPAEPVREHVWLQIAWMLGPLAPLALMFHWGFSAYLEQATPPDDAYVVRVRARQWAWEFEHPSGITEDNELHVPAGRAIRLVLSSSDVIHAFYAPELRIKRDAVPGMFTSMWFEAIVPEHVVPEGDLSFPDHRRELYRTRVHCAELCGASGDWGANAGHATMSAEIIVMRPEDFEDFGPRGPPCGEDGCTPLDWGELLFSQKGCSACHSREENGPPLAGPSLHALFGRETRLSDGSVVVVDEAYVRQSILQPSARVVEGRNPVMPRIRFSDEQLDALVAYLRTL